MQRHPFVSAFWLVGTGRRWSRYNAEKTLYVAWSWRHPYSVPFCTAIGMVFWHTCFTVLLQRYMLASMARFRRVSTMTGKPFVCNALVERVCRSFGEARFFNECMTYHVRSQTCPYNEHCRTAACYYTVLALIGCFKDRARWRTTCDRRSWGQACWFPYSFALQKHCFNALFFKCNIHFGCVLLVSAF